jgi:hypothetical protein
MSNLLRRKGDVSDCLWVLGRVAAARMRQRVRKGDNGISPEWIRSIKVAGSVETWINSGLTQRARQTRVQSERFEDDRTYLLASLSMQMPPPAGPTRRIAIAIGGKLSQWSAKESIRVGRSSQALARRRTIGRHRSSRRHAVILESMAPAPG